MNKKEIGYQSHFPNQNHKFIEHKCIYILKKNQMLYFNKF